MGVDNSPPFYVFQPDGSVRGLAVEVFDEAARRRGLRITWVALKDIPLDDALESRRVQIWPLVGSTPERKAKFFLSDPWLQSDYVLVSSKLNPVRGVRQAAGLRIAHARLRLTTSLAKRYLPSSVIVIVPDRFRALQEMCSGKAAAALIESRVVDAILLDRPLGCENLPLNISTVQGAVTPLAIAGVPEVATIVKELRAEIGKMAIGGELAEILDRWAPFSAEGTRSIWAERAAAATSRYMAIFAAALSFFAALLAWLAWRAVQLRKAAVAAQGKLQLSETRYRELFENNPLPAWLYDTATLKFIDVNQAAVKSYKYARSEFLELTLDDIRPVEDIPILHEFLSIPANLRTPRATPWRHRSKDGRIFLVESSGHSVATPSGELRMIMVNDVTERERVATQLKNSEYRYRSVVEHAADIIYQTDSNGRFTYSNNGALRVLGYTRNEVIGKPFTELIHPSDRLRAARFYATQRRRGIGETYFEFRRISGEGQTRWLGQNVQLLFDENRQMIGFQAIARDITERRAAEATLSRQAEEDPLTGLANRRPAMAALHRLIQGKEAFCLCLCDVDSFKTVNDTFGHASGDEVLRVFGDIIVNAIRRTDTAARIGGDEFCLILRNADLQDARQLADRIRQNLATVAFDSNDRIFSVTATFGITQWKEGTSINDLFEIADSALYDAKRKGKNRVR